MSVVPEKFQTAVANPRLIASYARREARLIRALASVSAYPLAALYAADLLSDGDRFPRYLESADGDRYVECDVLDFRLRVDLRDEGISRDLLVDGVREPLATARYRDELARLESRQGALTVVDVGANIGYFALLYPSQCREDGEVIAIEPHPDNFALLEENVRLNGFEDAVDCYRCAVGPESRSATMRVSTHSNLGTLTDSTRGHYVDEIDVPMRRLDDLLRETDVPFESVDALRMDIQGYEYEVIRGMSTLLRDGDVGLLFVEIHPWYLRERGEYEEFLATLEEHGFELAFAADGRTAVLHEDKQTYAERELDVDSLAELRDVEFSVEAILRG